MRLQLATLLVAIAAHSAAADGSLTARGAYYKERATRVMQPMLDGVFDLGARGLVTAHFLVDAITSASASAGSADAKVFTENRVEGGAGYVHQLDHGIKLGGEAKYSTESDYQSIYVGVRGEIELAEKNTVLGLGTGYGADKVGTSTDGGLGALMIVCKPGMPEQPTCSLDTYSLFASASQILSRRAVIGFSYDLAALRGYTANPYRSAVVGSGLDAGLVRETHPDERLRQALGTSLRYYVDQTKTAVIGGVRLYRDNWKVNAITPELRVVQQLGLAMDAAVRYRFHAQSAAFFYEERYPNLQAFVSDDVKLSKFTSHLVEAKVGIFGEAFGLDGRWGGARIETLLQYVVQNNRFGNAIVAHLALTVPFGTDE